MPLPPAAEAARQAAARSQSRRNMLGAAIAGTFVGAVFLYSITAVDQDEITERELAAFIRKRQETAAQSEAPRR
jgi:formate/nitrite transporter FocA (FNT family)